MDTSKATTSDPRDILAAQLGRAIEATWLITVVSVPLFAVSPETMLGFIEVPKVALLRGLAAVLAMFWLVEWMVRPSRLPRSLPRWESLQAWLLADRTHWIVVGLGAYVALNIASTVSSVSPEVSIWGKRPGGDGYGLYNILCYTVLFVAVLTHLKRQAQMWRLLGAVIVMGTLVAFHAILQHHGLDPFLERDNALSRPYATLGNPIFAAALLLMTSVMTMAVGFALHLRSRSAWMSAAMAASLGVQLLAVIYTLARGPWIGLTVGTVVFIGSVWAIFGARRIGPLVLAVLVAMAVSWAAALDFGLSGGQENLAESNQEGVGTQPAVQRALSIYPAIAEGGLSGRADTWAASLRLISERPWHDVPSMRLAWTRHWLGYGPDTFRFVYPLRSESNATASFPFEAHNVPLHIWVELGVIGLLAMVGTAFAVLWAGFGRLRSAGTGMAPANTVILAGLMGAFVGRGFEMMVGIPKVGDITVLAALLPLAVVLARKGPLGSDDGPVETDSHATTAPERDSRADWALFIGRTVLVLVVITALGALTWLKAANYARSDAMAAQAMALFREGDGLGAIRLLQKATDTTPDASVYYILAASIFDDLAANAKSADGRLRLSTGSYVFSANALAANVVDPGSRAVLANAAIRLGTLGQPGRLDEAVRLSEQVLAMMPNFAVSQYAAALAHLLIKDAERGLELVDAGDLLFDAGSQPAIAAEGAFLRGVAHRLKGEDALAKGAFERSLILGPDGRYAPTAARHLVDLEKTQ